MGTIGEEPTKYFSLKEKTKGHFFVLEKLCRLTHQPMQSHASRSELYGKKLINRLAERLKQEGVKGSSPTNLRKFREFYQSYAEIQQTSSVESLIQDMVTETINRNMSASDRIDRSGVL